jgi:hypothetical protein
MSTDDTILRLQLELRQLRDEILQLQLELRLERAKSAALLEQQTVQGRPGDMTEAAQTVGAFLARHGEDPRVAAWVQQRGPDSLAMLAIAGTDLDDLFGLL